MEIFQFSFRNFVENPDVNDYVMLANHLDAAQQKELHPALFSQREAVARNLRHMSQAPAVEKHRSAYHAMRLFVF